MSESGRIPIYSLRDVSRFARVPYGRVRSYFHDGLLPGVATTRPIRVSFVGLVAAWALYGIQRPKDDGSSVSGTDGVIASLSPCRDVWVSPNHYSGQPCLSGTRKPTAVIAGRFSTGETIRELADDYDETPERIEAAIRFELLTRGTV